MASTSADKGMVTLWHTNATEEQKQWHIQNNTERGRGKTRNTTKKGKDPSLSFVTFPRSMLTEEQKATWATNKEKIDQQSKSIRARQDAYEFFHDKEQEVQKLKRQKKELEEQRGKERRGKEAMLQVAEASGQDLAQHGTKLLDGFGVSAMLQDGVRAVEALDQEKAQLVKEIRELKRNWSDDDDDEEEEGEGEEEAGKLPWQKYEKVIKAMVVTPPDGLTLHKDFIGQDNGEDSVKERMSNFLGTSEKQGTMVEYVQGMKNRQSNVDGQPNDDLIRPPSGMIFCGPPGSGKTELSKIMASQTYKVGMTVYKVPEGFGDGKTEMWKALSEIATLTAPSLVIIDECDRWLTTQHKAQGNAFKDAFPCEDNPKLPLVLVLCITNCDVSQLNSAVRDRVDGNTGVYMFEEHGTSHKLLMLKKFLKIRNLQTILTDEQYDEVAKEFPQASARDFSHRLTELQSKIKFKYDRTYANIEDFRGVIRQCKAHGPEAVLEQVKQKLEELCEFHDNAKSYVKLVFDIVPQLTDDQLKALGALNKSMNKSSPVYLKLGTLMEQMFKGAVYKATEDFPDRGHGKRGPHVRCVRLKSERHDEAPAAGTSRDAPNPDGDYDDGDTEGKDQAQGGDFVDVATARTMTFPNVTSDNVETRKPEETQLDEALLKAFGEECRKYPGVYVVPNFMQDHLNLKSPDELGECPKRLLADLERYPTRKADETIQFGEVQWVAGENKALHYRGNPIKRRKIWATRDTPSRTCIRRYGYTGWQWDILPATVGMDQIKELKPTTQAYDRWCDDNKVPEMNHMIITSYKDDGEIGYHYDKMKDIVKDSIITVLKLGKTKGPFSLRKRLFTKPDFAWANPQKTKDPNAKELWGKAKDRQKREFDQLQEMEKPIFDLEVEPGTAIIMTTAANVVTEHCVKDLCGDHGSIVLRTIHTLSNLETRTHTHDSAFME
jgi:SpoVK/Ycf46/Vps4 family AAA+-type ATPase